MPLVYLRMTPIFVYRADMRAVLVLAGLTVVLVGCSAARNNASHPTIQVVAAENFWGSIAAQLGGSYVHVTSIVHDPATDPHDYEPSAIDARTLAGADFVIENGIGYDPWVPKLLAANPVARREVLDVGTLIGIPDGGNPHRWYSPPNVHAVIDAITRNYQKLDRKNASAFARLKARFLNVALRAYTREVATHPQALRRREGRSLGEHLCPTRAGTRAGSRHTALVPQSDQRRWRANGERPDDDRPPDLDTADQGLGVQQPEQHARRSAPHERSEETAHSRHHDHGDARAAGERLVRVVAARTVAATRARARTGDRSVNPLELTDAAVELGGRTIWHDVTLDVPPGSFTAVLGPNGAGKSTLLKVALGLLPLRDRLGTRPWARAG